MSAPVASAADDEVLVSAHGLGKKFCRDLRRSLFYGLADVWAELRCRTAAFGSLRAQEFWALAEASFELRRGQSLGIIGHNGAGKSTLLKLVAGLIKPDTGMVRVRGRVGALIALGAGFNPVLTGRENIHINAAVLGYSRREVLSLIDDIIEFSGLADFIDSPVQNYSNGMQVRLGFAVAVHLAPDIMLVDEVLAVGDTLFQRKCFDRIVAMREQGVSFVVVSHHPWQLESVCDLVAVVDHGRLSDLRPAKEAQALYHDLLQQQPAPAGGAPSAREGTHALYFHAVTVEDAAGHAAGEFAALQPLRIHARVHSVRPLTGVRFRFEVCGADNAVVSMLTTIGISETLRFDGDHEICFEMAPCQLTSGWYYVNAIAVDGQVRLDAWRRACEFKVALRDERARNLTSDTGTFVCPGRWEIR